MTLAERLAAVESKIADACRVAGRARATVQLVAVSKTMPVERCSEAVAAGQLVLGENYAQELRDKAPAVSGAVWHFLGPLQRNKVKYVVGTADLIQSVDSVELAAAIAQRATKQRCLIQVNVGAEPQKSGCAVAELPALVAAISALPSLELDGLMCIPPADGDPRPHFAALNTLADTYGLKERSMGMSADYEAAIAEGATIIRVGTAIFGPR